MNTVIIRLTLLAFGLSVTISHSAQAAVPQTYTNDNLWSTEHDVVTSINFNADGSAYGRTATGKTWRQFDIPNTVGIRLQKFTIDEAFYYIDGHNIILAQTDTEAIRLALGFES